MVKLYNHNFKREDINDVERGDVIIYPSKVVSDENNYLIVSDVNIKDQRISGQIASAIGVNALFIDDLIEAEDIKSITEENRI